MTQRSIILAALIGTASPGFAEPALSPGAPAGVHQAQSFDTDAVFIGAAIVIVGIGIWMAAGTTYTPPPTSTG